MNVLCLRYTDAATETCRLVKEKYETNKKGSKLTYNVTKENPDFPLEIGKSYATLLLHFYGEVIRECHLVSGYVNNYGNIVCALTEKVKDDRLRFIMS